MLALRSRTVYVLLLLLYCSARTLSCELVLRRPRRCAYFVTHPVPTRGLGVVVAYVSAQYYEANVIERYRASTRDLGCVLGGSTFGPSEAGLALVASCPGATFRMQEMRRRRDAARKGGRGSASQAMLVLPCLS